MKLLAFMTSKTGRILRIALGIVLFSVGSGLLGGEPRTGMALMALMPLAGGLFDFCLLGLLLDYPLGGKAARRKLAEHQHDPAQASCNPVLPWRVAALLALVIGAMAVYAGGKTLIGKLPNWSVLSWLPLYNYTLGLLAVIWAAPLLWRASKLARPLAIATFLVHTTVMVVLQTAFAGKVAAESLEAMWVRLFVWAGILVLLYLPQGVRRVVMGRARAEV